MNDELELNETVQARIAWLGEDALATIQQSPQNTILPHGFRSETSGERALAMLTKGTADMSLELQGTLGEGGMGIVRLGIQRSLGRKVAVKTLRDSHRNRPAVLKLLREAWVTGALEHPNILPIHDVRLDEDGMPLVVLKRLEGLDWSDVMHDADTVRERFGSDDLLEHNLMVLTQVCRAISFAHSRNIVHRDIKPDNVRIGAFGEVYLLDWGIAGSTQQDDDGRFPLATNELAGTPAYMAPEMLGGEGAPAVDERSDVYLLGATLYEIVAGEPPHRGETARAVIASVLRSRPTLQRNAPAELADIIQRCMQANADKRFESADQVRTALLEFLDHRGSMRLVLKATERKHELEAHLLEQANEDASHRVRAYDLFGECRSGFRGALELWNENRDAQESLRSVGLAMIEYELGRGDARTAATIRKHFDTVGADLDRRIKKGLRTQDKDDKRIETLEALEKDLDPSIGWRTRLFVSSLVAGMWIVLPFIFTALWPNYRDSYAVAAGLSGAALVLFAGVLYWARESMMGSKLNRQLGFILLSMFMSHFVLIAGSMLMGLDSTRSMIWFFFMWFIVTVVASVAVEFKLWPIAIAQLVSFLVASKWPETRYALLSISNTCVVGTLLWIWYPRKATQQPPSTRR
jgi:serine/threonine protein kinase